MLNSIPNIINKKEILGSDFNLFFNTSLETQCGNPILKKKILAKVIEIKKTYVIYGELRTLNQSALLFIETTFLFVFKEDWITF